MNRYPTGRSRPNVWRLALVLLGLSLVGIVLPPALTGGRINLVQILVPFQDGASRLLDVGSSADDADDARDDREIERLRSMIETLSAQNRFLSQENESLAGVRLRGLGQRGRLMPSHVVADDAAGWRESKLILGGTRRGIKGPMGVLSRHFAIDLTSDDGARDGMGVLAAEVLIGVVEQAGTHASRVRLLSDPETRLPVSIGRVEGDRFESVEADFLLAGSGRGRIEIREVHHKYVDERLIRVGDVVLTRDDESVLPPSVRIGTVAAMETVPDNALLYTLHIDPGVDMNDVRRVWVVDPGL